METRKFGMTLVAVAALGLAGAASVVRAQPDGENRPPRPPPFGVGIKATATKDSESKKAFLHVFPAMRPPRFVSDSEDTTETTTGDEKKRPPLLGILRLGDSMYLLKDVELTFVDLSAESDSATTDNEDEDADRPPRPPFKPISAIKATLIEAPATPPEPGSEEAEALESVGTLDISIAKGTKTINGKERTVPVVSGTAVINSETWTFDGLVLPPPPPPRFDRRGPPPGDDESVTGEEQVDEGTEDVESATDDL